MAVPVWGKASSGEQVTVEVGTQTKTDTASSEGTWKVTLDPMEAAGPLTMTIKGKCFSRTALREKCSEYR
jgi:sialate O-acetylesterase